MDLITAQTAVIHLYLYKFCINIVYVRWLSLPVNVLMCKHTQSLPQTQQHTRQRDICEHSFGSVSMEMNKKGSVEVWFEHQH